jgi:hypothetical protein
MQLDALGTLSPPVIDYIKELETRYEQHIK